MGPTPDRSISDPLLRPENGPRDALGKPVRAPLGNSIKTFLVFVVLVAIGGGIWWMRRPADLSNQLGGREWTITHLDDEPATNTSGTTSTFVLDGNGEIRAADGCNVATGQWSYDAPSSQITIDWETRTSLSCAESWPQTYLPISGEIHVDDGVMRITSNIVNATSVGKLRALSLVERQPPSLDDLAGTWVSGERTIEIGRRGLFEVDQCEGSWEPMDDGTTDEVEGMLLAVSFDEPQRADCDLDPWWHDETALAPVFDDGVIFMRRDRTIFPVDRVIVRLEPDS